MSRCPSDEELARFLDGQLPPEHAAQLERHFDTCASCHREVTELARLLAGDNSSPPPGTAPEPLDPLEWHEVFVHAPGTSLGRYELLEVLGIGGMGVVYGARDPVLDRTIAIKTLRRGPSIDPAPSGHGDRLLKEARALAQLSHPNVVEVFDVGTAGDEIYLAMERLGDRDVRSWLGAKPAWEEILSVFLDAGRGLAAAHDVGLVHRDFKPDNLLLGRDGRIRVVDFGLVAHSGQLSTEAARVAKGTRLVGTPAYMAPEQLAGAPADAQSDQYSFCVALHEAVYGQRPFPGSSLEDLRAQISASEPAPTGLLPAKTRHALAQGLRRDPGDRYPDMHALIDALAPAPRRRWVVGVVTSGAAVVGLVAWAGTAEAPDPCRDLATRMQQTWNEAARVELRGGFEALNEPFSADVWTATQATLEAYVRRWLEVHQVTCAGPKVGEPFLRPRHLSCLTERHMEFAALLEAFRTPDRDVALRALRAASTLTSPDGCGTPETLALRRPTPRDPALRQEVERLRGALATALALGYAGRFEESRQLTIELAARAERLGYDPLRAEVLYHRGDMEYELGDLDTAIATLDEAWLAAEAGAHDWSKAGTLATLVGFVGRRHDYASAHAYARRAEAIIARLEEPDELRERLLAGRLSLAASEGHVQMMVPWALEGLELARSLHGEGPRLLRATTNAALTLTRAGRLDEAQVHADRALALSRQLFGPRHPNVAVALIAAAEIAEERGFYDRALDRAREALQIEQDVRGEVHPAVADVWTTVALMATSAQRWDEAFDAYERALQIARTLDDAMRLADISNNRGNLHYARGQFDEAHASYRTALEVAEQSLGARHPRVALVNNNLGATMVALGRYEGAVPYHERALEIRREAFGPSDVLVARSATELGETLLLAGQSDSALTVLEDAVRIHGVLQSSQSVRGTTDFALARALWTASSRGPGERTPQRRARALEIVRTLQAALDPQDSTDAELLGEVRAWPGLSPPASVAGSKSP